MSIIETATTRVLLAGATATCMLWSVAAAAITIIPPGYTQQIVATIPGSASNHYGGVVEGLDGNAYVGGGNRPDAFRVTPTGTVTTLTLSATADVLGVGIIGTKLYVGQNDGRIDTFDISLPAPPATFLTTIPGITGNGNADFAVAPAGFGAFGGQLIASNGGVYAVNPTTGAKTDIVVAPSGDRYSSLGFGPNGTLYVADYENAQVLTVSAAGTTSVFATIPGSAPDGIAVHPGTGDIYVADSGNDSIHKITPAGVVSTFATDVPFDGGYYPAGLAFSNNGTTLYYLTNEGTFQLAVIRGFPSVVPTFVPSAVPTLGDTALLMLASLIALAGVAATRRARW